MSDTPINPYALGPQGEPPLETCSERWWSLLGGDTRTETEMEIDEMLTPQQREEVESLFADAEGMS
jgi:hypothetical protein